MISNLLIESIGFMFIVVGIPTGITLLFTKWIHSNDNKGGSKNGK